MASGHVKAPGGRGSGGSNSGPVGRSNVVVGVSP